MGKEHRRELEAQLQMPPGFRFRPTDEELIVHYLCRKAAAQPFAVTIIAEVDLYKYDPWDLPDKAVVGEKEWYFFSPRDRKYPNGSRPNRSAGSGYWKATGVDKPITTFGGSIKVGVKKALVFYTGRAPKAIKTNWIMHEYILADSAIKAAKKKGSVRLDDWVLCRIYNKTSGAQTAFQKEGGEREQRPHDLLASSHETYGFKLPDAFQLNALQGNTTMEQDVKSESNIMSLDLSEEELGHPLAGDDCGESTRSSLPSFSPSEKQARLSPPASHAALPPPQPTPLFSRPPSPRPPPPATVAPTVAPTSSTYTGRPLPLPIPLWANPTHATDYTAATYTNTAAAAATTATYRYPAKPESDFSPFYSDELPSPFWRLGPMASSFSLEEKN